MIPNASGNLESQTFLRNDALTKELRKQPTNIYKWEIVWPIVIIFSLAHVAAVYGLYLICFQAKFWTIVWVVFCSIFTTLGVTAGAHRLWSHRAYKAKWPMKLMLMIFQSAAYQNSVYRWVRNHRLHHKYTDTDADPYNTRRGFFFSHVGWLLIRRPPALIEKSATINYSDLEQDPFVMFQKRWYTSMMITFDFLLPTFIPYWYWSETLCCAWFTNIFRYLMVLHNTFMINSVAHKWGTKPYDKSITSTNNVPLTMAMLGEGWHNYHHVFPWDYRLDEFGTYNSDITSVFINACAFLGVASDLKTTSSDVIKRRIARNNKELH